MTKNIVYEDMPHWLAIKGVCDRRDIIFQSRTMKLYNTCITLSEHRLQFNECVECICQSMELLHEEHSS